MRTALCRLAPESWPIPLSIPFDRIRDSASYSDSWDWTAMTKELRASDAEPALGPGVVERVLERLGLHRRPSLDLGDLNQLYAAFCCNISFDNVQKRICFAGPQTTPLPGGDPTEFFNNFLRHGTGGTCWPLNGAMYALVHALGFRASRIVGSVIVEGYPRGANHGSVLVDLDGISYLVDAWMASFKVLPLISGRRALT